MVLAITSAQFLKKETVNKILITIVTLGCNEAGETYEKMDIGPCILNVKLQLKNRQNV